MKKISKLAMIAVFGGDRNCYCKNGDNKTIHKDDVASFNTCVDRCCASAYDADSFYFYWQEGQQIKYNHYHCHPYYLM